jgi:hypothetical protein
VKKLLTLLIIILLGVAGAYIYAPIKALKEIEHGFKTKNADEIAKNVDFEKLRENLKNRAIEKMREEAKAKGRGGEIDAILAQNLGKGLIDGMLGAYLTKDGLERLLKESKDDFDDENMEYSVTFKDINTFIVTIKDKKENKSMPVILKREGLFEWKVVDMEIPE